MFAYFDGDHIGDHIELLLLSEKINEARDLSEKLNMALDELKCNLVEELKANIILFGGDDILIEYEFKESQTELIEIARSKYKKKCGHTISCGVGKTLREAVEGLRVAKLMGRNTFIYMGKKVQN